MGLTLKHIEMYSNHRGISPQRGTLSIMKITPERKELAKYSYYRWIALKICHKLICFEINVSDLKNN